MQLISIEEIIQYKVLPFSIYTHSGEIILNSGEILTSGKLLQLRQVDKIYINEDEIQISSHEVSDEISDEVSNKEIEKIKEEEEDVEQVTKNMDTSISYAPRTENITDEIDASDISSKQWHFNKTAKIEPVTQMKLQAYFYMLMEKYENNGAVSTLPGFINLRNKILDLSDKLSSEAYLCSQAKILGEHESCHELNTAIMCAIVAQKMELTQQEIANLVLAALLHDIGKKKTGLILHDGMNIKTNDTEVLMEHTKIGYKIIKDEFKLPVSIAMMALEHHENANGSGYPFGKSVHQLSVEGKIGAVCNYFDNLTSNRTKYHIKTTKEALRKMLEMGSQVFAADVLYTIIGAFKYNDTAPIDEMKM